MYEGYTNRETWAVCLTINKNSVMHAKSKQMLRNIKAQWPTREDIPEYWEVKKFWLYKYAESLKAWITSKMESETYKIPKGDTKDLVENLIGLHHVNWREVAIDQMSE